MRRSRTPSPVGDRRVRQDAEILRNCDEYNVRRHGNYSLTDDIIDVDITFKDPADFTTLFIIDIIHDYFSSYVESAGKKRAVINERELIFLCDMIGQGMNAPTGLIVTKLWALLNQLRFEVHETIEADTPVRTFTIWDLEIQISRLFRSRTFTAASSPNEIITADACRSDSSRYSPCSDYIKIRENDPYRTVVTLATKLDAGFISEHADSDYCRRNQDYIMTDISIHLRTPTHEFSHCSYVRTHMRYKENTQTYIEPDLYKNKEFYRERFNTLRKLHSQDRERRLRMFRLFVNKFHGDFAQIVYARAYTEAYPQEPGEISPPIQVLTRDILMTVIATSMIGVSIYTAIGGNLVRADPNADTRHRAVMVTRLIKK